KRSQPAKRAAKSEKSTGPVKKHSAPPKNKMLRVGLTGSIAVGKSYVSQVLAELGCYVLDADMTARAVVAPGTSGLQKIVETFGPEVLRADGTLDRAKLGAIVFADEAKRQRLNA